jgi:hypothetical protein
MAYVEPGSLQPECDQIQEVDELAEHETFSRSILHPEVAQFFYESFDFWGWAPCFEVEPAEDALPGCADVLF